MVNDKNVQTEGSFYNLFRHYRQRWKFASGVTAIEVNLGKDVTTSVVDNDGKSTIRDVTLPPVALVPVLN